MGDVDKFLGKYSYVSSENFDEYMKAAGVSLAMRTIGQTLKNDMEITKEGDEYTITSKSMIRNAVVKFKLGVECDGETPDGRKVKNLFTMEDGILKTRQEPADDGGKASDVERRLDADGTMTVILTCDGVTAKRVYKKE